MKIMLAKKEERRSETLSQGTGWVCWCSVPSGVKVEKDCKIVFVATLTPSDTDPKFAFGKRPVLYMTKEEKAALKLKR